MSEWKLRILSGQHQGSEIPLAQGALTIGSDEQVDDVVLPDSDIDASMLTLDVDSQGVTLKATTTEVVQMGQKVVSLPENEPLATHQVIMVGPLQLVLGQLEDDLSEYVSTATLTRDSSSKAKNRSSAMRAFILMMTIGCIPGSLLAWLWFNPSTAEHSILTANESLQKVRTAAHHLNLDNVRVQWNDPSQQVVLQGYVDTKEQQFELLKRIDQQGINYKSEIRTMTDIKEGVRFVLDNLGYHHISVADGDTAGTLLLTGAIDDSSKWNQVERILETDVPGLVAWKVQIQKAGAYMDTLKDILSQRQLLDKVQLVEVADRIEVRGELDEPETSEFFQAADEFRQAWGERPFVVLKSMPLVTHTKNFTLPIRSISLGEIPYLTLSDNIKYAEGSRLPSGHRIERITDSSIDLSKGGHRLSIFLKGQQHAALN